MCQLVLVLLHSTQRPYRYRYRHSKLVVSTCICMHIMCLTQSKWKVRSSKRCRDDAVLCSVHRSVSKVNRSSVDMQVVSCHRYLVVFHRFVEQLLNRHFSYIWTRSAVVSYPSSPQSTSICHHKQHVPKRYMNYA